MNYYKGLTKQYKKIAKHQWRNGSYQTPNIPKDLADFSALTTEKVTRIQRYRKDEKIYYPHTGKM